MTENAVPVSANRPLPTTVAEVLTEVKAVLQRQGRTKGKNFRDGKVCLYAAVRVAAGTAGPAGEIRPYVSRQHELRHETIRALSKVAYRLHDIGAISFNDDDNTTDEQVYALIDATIEDQNTT